MKNNLHYQETSSKDYLKIIRLWEKSVLSSHPFLKSDDFHLIKSKLTSWLEDLGILSWYINDNLIGFSATNKHHLDMLFLDPNYFGKGYGTLILRHLITNHHITTVDVNEQNTSAVNFYTNHGFEISSRDMKDGMNLPYPILHLSLK